MRRYLSKSLALFFKSTGGGWLGFENKSFPVILANWIWMLPVSQSKPTLGLIWDLLIVIDV